MSQAGRTDNEAATNNDATDEMIKYGIRNVPVDCYYHGEYRYTNLRDAIAQAKRATKRNQRP